MKVLNVNKFFYIKGGSETYYFALKNLLEKNGNEVIDFSMKHEKNMDSKYSEYFVENIDYDSSNNLFNKFSIASKIIYSVEARNKIGALIKDYRPDIAHLNMFQHQLSPSILYELKKNNIPIVYTVHEPKPMCPNHTMLCKGAICEKCINGKYINCLKNRCVKDSYTKSFINTLEMYIHKLLRVYDLIDVFITPSKFFRDKLIECGYNPYKILYVPNFLDLDNYVPCYDNNDYFIYIGRISEEKGILTLINSISQIKTTKKLYIIGSGPLEEKVKNMIKTEHLDDKVEMLGFKSGIELEELLKHSMFSIIPSEWYENAPYAVLEMMAFGKPVIGSDIGGIPELIENEKTGLIYKAFDSSDLASKINHLLLNKDQMKTYGINSRKKLTSEFNSSLHYERIISIYKSLINR